MISGPPHVHGLRVPLPFKMDPLNAWLIETAEGCVLVDSGMQTQSSWKALERGLLASGHAWGDVRWLVVTHMHPDHVGLAGRVREASGARIAMHVKDADLLDEFSRPGRPEHWNRVALELAGSPQEMLGPVNAAFGLLTVSFPRTAPDMLLTGGETIAGLEILWTPGHSPGHICLYDREKRLLFGGDHLLESVSPNISWLPDANPLSEYLDSLRELLKAEIELVLPGHGEPFTEARACIEKTLAHHKQRCAQILEILRQEKNSAHKISQQLWKRELDPIEYRFAIFEVLAHLIYLESRGELRREGTDWIRLDAG